MMINTISMHAGNNKSLTSPTSTKTAYDEMIVTTPAFKRWSTIPTDHICTKQAGGNISPEISWVQVPLKTETLALIVTDPDAQDFVHWIVFNIPPERTLLPKGFKTTNESYKDLTKLQIADLKKEYATIPQGVNGFGTIGYAGPCPPVGKPHRSVFTLYALDTRLKLTDGANVDEVRKAMNGHIVDQDEMVGFYQNPTKN